MENVFLSKKKMGIMILLSIIITIGLATAAPLDIVIEEKVNTTATPSSDGTGAITFSYTTNVTGYLNITNKANEAIYDIWIAVNLVNNSTACSLYHSNASSVVSVGPSLTIPAKINKPGVFNTTGANR
ncbi:MAG: hypothetical protein NZ894_02005, partial [Archaeoglobaceae archaeon]|nr:hypothetical protein [Archaeoglobaceae archaeon]